MEDVKIAILIDVDIDNVHPYDKNIFDHSKNIIDIANSIRDFGYNKLSIGIDENNIMLYGHGTLAALKYLKYTAIPILAKVIGLSEENKKMYRVVDNITSKNTSIIRKLVEEEFDTQLIFNFGRYGLDKLDLFDTKNTTNIENLDKIKEEFLSKHKDFKKPGEKYWLYVELDNEKDYEYVVSILGYKNSRRVIDTKKLLETLNEATRITLQKS